LRAGSLIAIHSIVIIDAGKISKVLREPHLSSETEYPIEVAIAMIADGWRQFRGF
jgi:hypothetical protein